MVASVRLGGWSHARMLCMGARSFFQVASQVTTVYNVKMTGSSDDLYSKSTAAFSWANFDIDGASLPFPHTRRLHTQRLAFGRIELCMHVCEWQATSTRANASHLASASGY